MANYEYQYGTSPKKIEPYYNFTTKKKSVKKKKIVKKSSNNMKNKKSSKNKRKNKLRIEIRILINTLIIFGIIFAVIAFQALVEQKYKEKENLLAEYNDMITKINSTQEVNENLRSIAEGYGMQAKAATMLNLEKEDYVEIQDENQEKEKSFFERIAEFFN